MEEMEELVRMIEYKLKMQKVNKRDQNYIDLLKIIKHMLHTVQMTYCFKEVGVT